MQMAVRLPEWLRFTAAQGIRLRALMLMSPPIGSMATIEMFCRRSIPMRVRILQQTSVMLGHCRMRSRSKPQLHMYVLLELILDTERKDSSRRC